MVDIEKKLKQLPLAKLSKRVDIFLRFKFWQLSWQHSFSKLSGALVIKKSIPVAIIISLLAMVIGLPYYAYASSQVVRGDILYPVKQVIERVELNLAQTPEKKVEVYNKLAERRLSEIETLSNQQTTTTTEDNLAATIDEMGVLTTQASTQIASSPASSSQQQPAAKIVRLKEKQLIKMEEIANQRGLSANDKLLDSLALALDDLKQGKKEKDALNTRVPFIQISTSSKAYYDLRFSRPGRASTTIATTTASSTVASKPGREEPGRGQAKFNQEIIVGSLFTAKERVGLLRNSLSAEAIATSEMENLFIKLNTRLEKAQSAIDSGNFNQAQGLIKSTDALSNNAKQFLKHFERASSTPWQVMGEDRKNSKKRFNNREN
ncbi:MAG: DUF5667 domain-containing protein [Candidatus Falkowbacteria bacterium]|nr:DUF5667 domain-containing protein [Candidatus Falkowbacteria bacterium]